MCSKFYHTDRELVEWRKRLAGKENISPEASIRPQLEYGFQDTWIKFKLRLD